MIHIPIIHTSHAYIAAFMSVKSCNEFDYWSLSLISETNIRPTITARSFGEVLLYSMEESEIFEPFNFAPCAQ